MQSSRPFFFTHGSNCCVHLHFAENGHAYTLKIKANDWQVLTSIIRASALHTQCNKTYRSLPMSCKLHHCPPSEASQKQEWLPQEHVQQVPMLAAASASTAMPQLGRAASLPAQGQKHPWSLTKVGMHAVDAERNLDVNQFPRSLQVILSFLQYALKQSFCKATFSFLSYQVNALTY